VLQSAPHQSARQAPIMTYTHILSHTHHAIKHCWPWADLLAHSLTTLQVTDCMIKIPPPPAVGCSGFVCLVYLSPSTTSQ